MSPFSPTVDSRRFAWIHRRTRYSRGQVGGVIALVQDGDVVTIDAEKNRLDVAVSDEELDRRRKAWVAPPLKVQRGNALQIHQERQECVGRLCHRRIGFAIKIEWSSLQSLPSEAEGVFLIILLR